MTFEEYQSKSRETAMYPDVGSNLTYPVLGLCGETGEVAEKVKKLFRDHNGIITPEFKEAVKRELGDVLWYLAQISAELGFSLEDTATANIEKLRLRKEQGVLHGSGDNR